jgi:8-amino-7-oxononanoate synthase
MDIFAKCHSYTETKMIRQLGLYPFFRKIEGSSGPRVNIEGREIIMTGSNNYLGLTHDPRVIEAAQNAVAKYGSGCTGSRFLNGNIDLHCELEEKLAALTGKEDALVFSTGFTANQGTLESLCNVGDVIISDKENHASIISGCKMAKSQVKRYDFKKLSTLTKALRELEDHKGGKLLITDGVFSMSGAIAPLDKIVKLTEGHDVRIMVDDAHSLGTLGNMGAGTADHFGVTNKVDIIMGTFSKTFGSIGGFIAADAEVIEYVKHKSRSFMFSASIPPSAAATALKCCEIMQTEPEIHESLRRNTTLMREGLKSMGVDNLGSVSPINPILVKDDLVSFRITAELFDMGIYVTPVVFPAVSKGEALLRTSVMASHTTKDIEKALDCFEKVVKKYKLDFARQSESETFSEPQIRVATA